MTPTPSSRILSVLVPYLLLALSAVAFSMDAPARLAATLYPRRTALVATHYPVPLQRALPALPYRLAAR